MGVKPRIASDGAAVNEVINEVLLDHIGANFDATLMEYDGTRPRSNSLTLEAGRKAFGGEDVIGVGERVRGGEDALDGEGARGVKSTRGGERRRGNANCVATTADCSTTTDGAAELITIVLVSTLGAASAVAATGEAIHTRGAATTLAR